MESVDRVYQGIARSHDGGSVMTNPPTFSEMMAVADRAREWDVKRAVREAQDGFLIEQWNEDGDVFGCLGHVDREAFLAQWRWIYTEEGDPAALDDVTVDQVEHRYVLVDPADNAEYLFRWYVPCMGRPLAYTHVHAQTRAVTADDPGAEPVTMLDL